jgi:DNA mismatch endonuclease (patch repair protein)
MMSSIRSKDTSPELLIRKALFSLGMRYRLHSKELPGKPDLFFPKYRAAVQVHGCFWHGHCCHLFKWPATRPEFWEAKIRGNMERDSRNLQQLEALGYRQLTVWECALKGKHMIDIDTLADRVQNWITSGLPSGDISGGR